jgi:hypothetical protein
MGRSQRSRCGYDTISYQSHRWSKRLRSVRSEAAIPRRGQRHEAAVKLLLAEDAVDPGRSPHRGIGKFFKAI